MLPFLRNMLTNSRGFTFIEAILTTTLLSIGLWGGIAMMHNATNHSINNDYRLMGIQLANEKIELIIADKAFKGYDWIAEGNYPDEDLSEPYSGFSRTVSITEVSPSDLDDVENPVEGSGYKRVDVEVIWGGQSHEQITVSTVLTDYS
jgi:Tfp pilus assembly protein PilV